jgi:hypothetical protein
LKAEASAKAFVRVQQRLELLHVPADCEMMIKDQKEKKG